MSPIAKSYLGLSKKNMVVRVSGSNSSSDSGSSSNSSSSVVVV